MNRTEGLTRFKLGVSIGLTCLMLIGCQQGIRDYIGAVGLTRVHADELIVYPCIPLTEGRVSYLKPTDNSWIERIGKRIRAALYASAREVYESRRIREASASDRGGYVGADDTDGAADVLPETYGTDVEQYSEVPESDYQQEVISLYEEPAEDYSENLTYLGEFTATAYCACPICCGEYSSGYTASGTLAEEGRTIACNSLPFGTQVMIDSHIYTVEDTGWSPYGENWLDIFYQDHDSALAFGMRTVDVYLIG